MRSLVSDLIPEYNKKLQFFLKRHWLMLWNPPLSPLSFHLPPAYLPSLLWYHQPMCTPLTWNHIGTRCIL